MKKLLLSLIGAFVIISLSAQITENFTSYTVGGKLAQQAQDMGRDYWTTWSNAPGGVEDCIIQEKAGKKSVNIVGADADQVLMLGNKSSGQWTLQFQLLVPSGSSAYFNVLTNFPPVSALNHWAMQVYFGCEGEGNNNLTPGVGTIHAGGSNAAGFTISYDKWMDIKVFIDLDADQAKFYVENQLIHSWIYTTNSFNQTPPCPKIICAMDYFPPATHSNFYVAAVSFGQACNFDDKADGAYVAQSYPTMWTTWENLPGTHQDALITNEQSQSPNNSAKLTCVNYNAGLGSDLVYRPGDLTKGIHTVEFDMYIPNSSPAYFNILHKFLYPQNPTNDWWAVGVYFNTANYGTCVRINGQNTVFTPPNNKWFPVSIYIDFEIDIARISIDGEQIKEWQFSNSEEAGFPPLKQLAALDFFPPETGASYYVDNFAFDVPRIVSTPPIPDPVFNFDELTAGKYVAQSYPDWWTTWGDNPGTAEDALISTEQAQSAPNSAKCATGTDLLFKAGDVTTGAYTIEFDMYIPDNKPAFFNLLHKFDGNNSIWAIGVYFNITKSNAGPALGTYVQQNKVIIPFDAPSNKWFPVLFNIDLDKDIATLSIDGNMILGFQFSLNESTGATLNQLAAVDFFPPEDNTYFYFDNFKFLKGAGLEAKPNVGVTPDKITGEIMEGSGETITETIAVNNTLGTATATYESKVEFAAGGANWLTFTGTDINGTLLPGGIKTFKAVLDAKELEKGAYDATIIVTTNDPTHQKIEIPCKLTVGENGIEDYTIDGVTTKIFPNPASDLVTVDCNMNINSIQIINSMGQIVNTVTVNNNYTTLDTSNLGTGVYFIKVITDVSAHSSKLIIK